MDAERLVEGECDSYVEGRLNDMPLLDGSGGGEACAKGLPPCDAAKGLFVLIGQDL